MKLLTNLTFEPKGKHDLSLAYAVKDTVMSADGSRVYFALQDVPAGVPLDNAAYWKLQIDLSATKSAMDEFIATFGGYAKEIGTRVKGEIGRSSGNPVTVLPDAGSLLMPVTVLEPKQQGSGDPSPGNIRPINGWDKLELNVAGKNLFKNTAASQTINGVTFTVNTDGSVTANGTADAQAVFSLTSNQTFKNGSYILTGMPFAGSTTTFHMYYRIDGSGYNMTGLESGTRTFTVLSAFQIIIEPGYAANNLTFYPMIRLASDPDATYEPYAGKLHTVQIGQTVYGGKMDWLTGKLAAEWTVLTLDGTEPFQSVSDAYNNTGRTFLPIDQPGYAVPSNQISEIACSHYPTVMYNSINSTDGIIGVSLYPSGMNIAIRMQFTDMNAWKAYLAAQYAVGTPVQIVYKLATPVEIQLAPAIISATDPEQANTLYGDGRIDVEYVKPLRVSIEERVAAAVAAAMHVE